MTTNYDGDYISIMEINSKGNQKLIASLSATDTGPRQYIWYSNWDKKVISISTNRMSIEFKSDDFLEYKGFSANIYFTPMPNKECESWFDMDKKILKSPNYPQSYHISKKCSWLVTMDHDSHITLNFIEFYVRLSKISNGI